MNEIQVSIGQFESSFAQLPDSFFKRLNPTPVRSPTLLAFNRELAVELGLDTGGLSPD